MKRAKSICCWIFMHCDWVLLMYIGPLDHGYIFFWVYVSNGEKKSDVELHRKYAQLRLKWLSRDLYMESIMTLCVLKWLCGNRNRWHNSLDLQLIADIAGMQHFINGTLKQWTSTDFYCLHTWSNWCSHSSSGIQLEFRIPALSLAFRGIPTGVGLDNIIFAVFSDHHSVPVVLIHSLVSDLPSQAFPN